MITREKKNSSKKGGWSGLTKIVMVETESLLFILTGAGAGEKKPEPVKNRQAISATLLATTPSLTPQQTYLILISEAS